AGPELSGGPWISKKGKKDGLGIFAKLLSGLVKNLGNGPPGSKAFPEEAVALEGGGPGEMPEGKALQKNKDFPKIAFSRNRGESGAEDPAKPGDRAGVFKKAARKGEDAGEAVYLLSRAETPAGKARTQDLASREKSPAPEAVETGLLFEGETAVLPLEGEDPADSGFPPREASFSGPESPVSRGDGFPGVAEALSGESLRSSEAGPGSSGAGKTEKDEKQPAGARRAEKRRERPVVFETRDLRSGQETGAAGLKESASLGEKRLPGQEIDLAVELGNRDRGSSSMGKEKTLSQAFEDILARELHQNLNGDIVRHASVMLRDGGEGLIRLSLKPDTLGNVKIRLEMAENKITGHIVVESDEALRAFQREIGALEQAFKDSGFESDLSMSLASGDSGAEGRQDGERAPFFSESFAAGEAASRYDALTEKTDVLFATGSANGLKPGNGHISVNLLI
ncbi:MAG: flagellar hook-length control protein FliK, partial [Treponema sp.]|nr:flagellar hook-length control protein FliK [Treponema sp.]